MRARFIFACLAALSLSACGPEGAEGEKIASFEKTWFGRLPGWAADDHAAALETLRLSCARIVKADPKKPFGRAPAAGETRAWQEVCAAMPESADQAQARAFFETRFVPYVLRGPQGRDGLFTGYYEPLLKGARRPRGPYRVPLYARPDDLVTVDLGAFKPDLRGQSVTGRVSRGPDGARLVPYHARKEIEKGAIKGTRVLAWVNDATDAFFLHIQGSGLIQMEDGSVLRAGYAAQNGLPYTPVGRELIRRGVLTRETVSMQAIRAWLEAHPKEAQDLLNVNESYVFFRDLGEKGPLGAEGVVLTPRRSLAVDSRHIPYGAPVFIDAQDPTDAKARLRRLMIAQDTGGAIRGAVRGDVFWGAGATAAETAGVMKSPGSAYVLLPRGVTPPESLRWTPLRSFLRSLGL